MIVGSGFRKLVLTAHITTSVGWLGALVSYLALDLVATTGQDVETVRAAYLAMEFVAFSVILPLAVASLLIGIVNSVVTPWGLFRHYWVLVKLLLTVLAVAVLLLYGPTIRHMAELAATTSDPRELPGSLLHSGGGLVVLLLITVLSVYKPQGVTPYGWRKQRQQRRTATGSR